MYKQIEASETGATPNFTYLRDRINLEYVDEYRMHVPSCLPQRHKEAQRNITPPPGEPSEPSEPTEPNKHLPFGVKNLTEIQPDLVPVAGCSTELVQRSEQVKETESTSQGRLKEEEKKGNEAEGPPQTIAAPPGIPTSFAPFFPSNRFSPPGPFFILPFRPPPSHMFQRNPFRPCNSCNIPPNFHPYPKPSQFSSPFGPPQFMPPFGPNFFPNCVPNNQEDTSQQNTANASAPPNDPPTKRRATTIPQYCDTTISLKECEVFFQLSKVNIQAANTYIVEIINRAMANTTSTTTPAKFRSVTTQTEFEN